MTPNSHNGYKWSKKKRKKRRRKSRKKSSSTEMNFTSCPLTLGRYVWSLRSRQARQLESSIRSLNHIHTYTHTNQKKKKKRNENPEQKQQNKLVWPNIRCGACNTGEQDTLTLCTPSPSNCYSQNSENEYVNINAHTQKMNIMSVSMPTCEAQFDSMYWCGYSHMLLALITSRENYLYNS